MDPALDALVDAVESGSVDLADAALRRDSAVPPPTVHLLHKHLRQPYIGSVATRPFRRGADAAAAVTRLGLLPSVTLATRLVVVWEYADLCAALDFPGGPFPLGLVVLDADLTDHVVHWHPFQLRGDPIRPEWGPVLRHPAAQLPAPVAELLALWRELRRHDVTETRAKLEGAGFVITWAADLAASTATAPRGLTRRD
ncbi:hypothetical protein [Pseudonocardia abyssalis]|uniref:Uncharacterized protein n=1 Tax=Pseudonocardia abyssalis TaxID=2792008 RepID=A0ABS6UZK5_9PSEU|nr:hypothetical protein [Pseudonocardia abyssalis]MBW0114039.1 hypothetical protein [Pseudonocardia abyssalis]MBW0137674.1 hypothetical protein [Pseudonocardia abyssalis]